MLATISPPILWLCLGLILIVIEVFSMTFAFMFFGLSALVVALVTWQFGLESHAGQMVLFGVLGLAAMLILRKPLQTAFVHSKGATNDIGRLLTMTAPIAAGQTGQAEYLGVPWQVRNDSAADLNAGDTAMIVAVQSIQLVVRPARANGPQTPLA